MEPQLVLMRIETSSRSSSKTFTPLGYPQTVDSTDLKGVAKWDVNHPFHLAMSQGMGILRTYTLQTTGEDSKAFLYPCGCFQLHLDFKSSEIRQEPEALTNIKIHSTKKSNAGIVSMCLGHGRETRRHLRTKPVEQAWGSFEFIPGRPREIVFFQAGSSRILFARLPGKSPGSPKLGERSMARIDSSESKVYCVGRHSSTIFSIAVKGDGLALVSAARDGYIRIWRISDGSMLAQTMFSRWRQPRSPRHGKRTKSPFGTDKSEDEMHKLSSTMQVLSFLRNSSDLYMGCPNGEVRIWCLMECESNRLTLTEVGNGTVGKDIISALALHVANHHFPIQSNAGDNQSCPGADPEFLAIGTINQSLQVWTKQATANEWLPLWSSTLSIEGASIVSLSFRADGGLLAVSASRSGKSIGCSDYQTNASDCSSPDEKQPCDRLYIYNTSSWACEGWLSFTSHLGSCLFYLPHFTAEDKNDSRSSASQRKVAACRLLLVSTSSGPQTHILPEFGLFGSTRDQSEQPDSVQLNSELEEKSMHCSNLKRVLLPQCQGPSNKEIQAFPEVEGEGDGGGGGSCHTLPVTMELENDTETGASSSAQDRGTGRESRKSSKEGPVQELLGEHIGLRSLRQLHVQDRNSRHQSYPHKTKTKTHARKSGSKEKRSYLRGPEASLVPRGHAIRKHRFKTELPAHFFKRICHNCEKSPADLNSPKQQNSPSSSKPRFCWNRPPPSLQPFRAEDTGTENVSIEANVPNVKDSYVRRPMNASPIAEQKTKTQTTQALRCPVEETDPNPKLKKEVTFSKTPEYIPSPVGGKTARSEATNSHSRKKGEQGHLGVSRSMKFWRSRKENPNSHGQKKPLTQHITRKAKSRPRIGGKFLQELLIMNEEHSPFKDKVQMGATFRETRPLFKSLVVAQPPLDYSKTSEDKAVVPLNRPVAFSTTNLMQRLQDIEHETFDLDAALQVAKAKGIVLSKHDREEIKAALEEEKKAGAAPKSAAELEGRKPTARYSPLLKIPDPRLSHHGPSVAPRRAKKQSDVRGEEMHTIQPALFDLWDLEERCPQVSSANLQQPNTFSVTGWRKTMGDFYGTSKSSVWGQREDVCRGAACAQAVYGNCLYRPVSEPPCHCYEEQQNSNVYLK